MDSPVDGLPLSNKRGNARHIRLQIHHKCLKNRAGHHSGHECCGLYVILFDLTNLPLHQVVAVGVVICLLDDLLGASNSVDMGGAGNLKLVDAGPVGAILFRAASTDLVEESSRVL